jgi:hypothetical protein
VIAHRIVCTCVLVGGVWLGCGGGQAAPKNGPASARKPDGSGEPAQDTGPRLPSCDDGSCVVCGDGICPTGFYCESHGGVTGCAWSAACARKPTCECLRPTIQGEARCSCEERKGTAFVACGG